MAFPLQRMKYKSLIPIYTFSPLEFTQDNLSEVVIYTYCGCLFITFEVRNAANVNLYWLCLNDNYLQDQVRGCG